LLSREFVIFNEVHHASKSYHKVSRVLKNAYWRLGVSATVLMGNKEKKLNSMALTGPLLLDVKLDKLVKSKHLAKPTAIFIEIPMQSEDVQLEYAESWGELYFQGIVYNEVRNYILAHALIAMKNRGCSSLALVERIEHGHNIVNIMEEHRKGWNVQYVSGEHDSKTRDKAILDIQNKALDVLVTSRIFNEDIDIPLLESVINCAGYKDEGLTYQRTGRGIRKTDTKDYTIYIDCYDMFNLKLLEHSEKRLKLCKKSKAFDIEVVKWESLEEVLDHVFERRGK
jgi:superfamily II DNA or RNA helicase